tara:strand:+ start:1999 stop:2544 length:546 start_codon:yes stop_codon:yes gene_type:complete
MKTIKIVGKRNVDGFNDAKNETKNKIKAKKKRKKVLDIKNSNVLNTLNNKSQIELLNQLYLEENYTGVKFMKREVERKLNSYKNQDIKKKKYNENKFIKYEECLEKLVISKLKCDYCRKNCFIYYENKLEPHQWTLDRINNDIGHEKDNSVICCYKCNIKRGRIDDKKFKFTKQLRIIKGF